MARAPPAFWKGKLLSEWSLGVGEEAVSDVGAVLTNDVRGAILAKRRWGQPPAGSGTGTGARRLELAGTAARGHSPLRP